MPKGKGKCENAKLNKKEQDKVDKAFCDINMSFLNVFKEMNPESTQEHETPLYIGVFFREEIPGIDGTSLILLIREKILEVYRMFARRRTPLHVLVNTSTDISAKIYGVLKNVEVEAGAIRVFETKDHRTGRYAWIEQDEVDMMAIHLFFWSELVPWPEVKDIVNLTGLDVPFAWRTETGAEKRVVMKTNGEPPLKLVDKQGDWSLSSIKGMEDFPIEMEPTKRLEWHKDESELPKYILVNPEVAKFMARGPYQIRVFYPVRDTHGTVTALRYLNATTQDFEA